MQTKSKSALGSSLDPSGLHFLQNGREQDPSLGTWQRGLWSDSAFSTAQALSTKQCLSVTPRKKGPT